MSKHTVVTFIDHPFEYFDQSVTKMHSLPRAELEELQREAMMLRFAQHREGIEMVRKLADRLGITSVDKFNDVVPLMFSHTTYKSYPPALIDNKRFDLMTRWLAKITIHDLSEVDATGAESIDEWLEAVESASKLQVITSSGTTGTLSIIPKDELTTVEACRSGGRRCFSSSDRSRPRISSIRWSM
ncbi:hypothetical protein [Nocardia sp. CA-120079]|uniref:hypothetical protein n=1 Tax=Nocardia sp. CA-120079 TaxID=3239974 RepID=UPI003D9655CE